jgi:glycerol-3-phosphate dehydrogenase (NAD(P)+)
VGAGAWGTSFAVHLARLGHSVVLAPRREEHAEALRNTHENVDYLPGIVLPASLRVEADLHKALQGCSLVLLACPAQALRETSRRVKAVLGDGGSKVCVLSLSKGLESGSHLRPSQVMEQELPDCLIGAITGPTNAAEVARGLPAAMVLAMNRSDDRLGSIQLALSCPTLRLYTSDDIAGIEYGGCLKNIYAIAAGCCDGLVLGDNAKAALLTRALAEMIRVGVSLGARGETFYGLGGFGDLVATCHGAWSRNRGFGQMLGEGLTAAEIFANRKTVVEGYKTAESFYGLCRELDIDAPILSEVYRICFEGKTVRESMLALMTRVLKKE